MNIDLVVIILLSLCAVLLLKSVPLPVTVTAYEWRAGSRMTPPSRGYNYVVASGLVTKPEAGKSTSSWKGYVPIYKLAFGYCGKTREIKEMDANRAHVINVSRTGKTVVVRFDNTDGRRKYQRRSSNDVHYERRVRNVREVCF